MAINLLDMLKEQMTDAVVGNAANIIGENASATSSAVSSILPTILGSVISKGSTESGAGRLLNMIADGKHDGGVFDNLGSLLGGGDATTGFMKTGGSLLSGLLGNNLGSVIDLVTSVTGMRRNSSSSLMNMIAPMVMGMIGRYVRKNGLNAGGLMKMLLGQKKHVASAMPAGMGSLLGFGETTGSAARATATSHQAAETKSGGGFMKWLIPIAAVLGGLWLWNSGILGGAAETVGNAASGAMTTVKDAAGNVMEGTVNAAGDLVDASGNVIKKAGEFTVDAAKAAGNAAAGAMTTVKDAAGNVIEGTVNAAGDLVDGTGKVIKKAGEFTVDAASAAGNAAAGAMTTVKDAAGNVMDGTINAAGDLVDASGNVLAKAGEFTVDAAKAAGSAAAGAVNYTVNAAGDLVDGTGNVIAKKGEFKKDADGNFLSKAGTAIAGAAAATGKAVGNAADATGDALKAATAQFQSKFTGMFKKADEARKAGGGKVANAAKKVTGKSGDVSGSITYALTDIVFKDGSQRVQTFKKAEVEGLAAALKSYPNAKIKVQTSGDNKALAGQRATAVHDMLVALGVNKKQLSSKGMKGDATKVEIVVQ